MYPKIIFLGMGLYEICIILGVLAVLLLADKFSIKRKFSIGLQKLLIIGAVGAIALGFLGAILFQAVYDWLATGEFSLQAGMTFYGGFIFGVGGFLFVWFVVSKPFGVYDEAVARFKDVADMAGWMVPLAHGFGRLGCLFAGCCHGDVTSAWYGVRMWVFVQGEWQWAKVVPIQLFEAIALFALSAALFFVYIKRNASEKTRVPVLPLYGFAYGIWRFCIEFARGDDRGSSPIPFLTPSQFSAVILIVASIGYFCIWLYKKTVEVKEDGKNGSDAGL